ncbi:MAG: VCBS repeat-containing protein [Balneolaceae bacterium]
MKDRWLSAATLLILVCVVGCSSVRPAADQYGTEYARDIDPFPVFDLDGVRIEHSFVGGFNAPRPQWVDLYNSGQPDLFIQEYANDLMYFRNQSDESGQRVEWVTDRFQDLDIGEWFRFVDVNGDDIYDLITEQPYSYIRYYRNTGTAEEPSFELAADTLKDVNGIPIYSDRQNIPNIIDINCDGQPDLFIGRLDGTVMRFSSRGYDDQGVPRFELVNRRFENIEIVKEFGTLHGANSLDFADINGDGLYDIYWGDFFEPGLLRIRNEGTCNNLNYQVAPTLFPPDDPINTSGFNAPAFGDWTGNGLTDLLVGVLGGAYNAFQTQAENLLFYEHHEDGRFTLQTRQFLRNIDIGNESLLAAGDINGNGLTDLLLANKIDPSDRSTSMVYILENRGSPDAPEFHMAGTLHLPPVFHYAPALGDLNGNGYPDLLLGTWGGEIHYYRNSGGQFELETESIAELPRGSNSTPALADLNGNGLLDLVVGSSGGDLHFFMNEGTKQKPQFRYLEGAHSDVTAGPRSVPYLHDFDGNGLPDLFIGTRGDGLLFYRNRGSSDEPHFVAEPVPAGIHTHRLGAPLFTDLNGDGVAEFLSGGQSGGLIYFRGQQGQP